MRRRGRCTRSAAGNDGKLAAGAFSFAHQEPVTLPLEATAFFPPSFLPFCCGFMNFWRKNPARRPCAGCVVAAARRGESREMSERARTSGTWQRRLRRPCSSVTPRVARSARASAGAAGREESDGRSHRKEPESDGVVEIPSALQLPGCPRAAIRHPPPALIRLRLERDDVLQPQWLGASDAAIAAD